MHLQTQNYILIKWLPLPNSFSRWNWCQNIPKEDGNAPNRLHTCRWDSCHTSPSSFFETNPSQPQGQCSLQTAGRKQGTKWTRRPQKVEDKHDWGWQQKELTTSASVVLHPIRCHKDEHVFVLTQQIQTNTKKGLQGRRWYSLTLWTQNQLRWTQFCTNCLY